MYSKIINLLKQEIKEYEENIYFISSKIRDIKPIYDILKPNGRNFNVGNVIKITENEELLEKLFEIVKKNNYIVVKQMIDSKVQYKLYLEETSKWLSEMGLSRDIIYSNAFLRRIKSIPNSQEVCKVLESMKENERKLIDINRDITNYVCNTIVNIYERLIDEKEDKKNKKKSYESALKEMRRGTPFSPKDIATVTNLININVENKTLANEMLSSLNKYIESTNKPKQISSIEKEEPNHISKYVDEDVNSLDSEIDEQLDEEDSKEKLYYNYLITIKSFNNYNEINMFLNSLGEISNIKKIVDGVINILTDSDEDELLKNFLISYLTEHTNYDTKIEEDDSNKKITVLYYGFLTKKQVILDDIEKHNISSSFYPDIIKGINIIKRDGGIGKIDTYNLISKDVLKLRVRDIRITYKKLANNLYIILGIFLKKDRKGLEIIKTSDRRNCNLLEVQNSIIEAEKIDTLWNEYLNQNSEIEEAINAKLLNRKVK